MALAATLAVFAVGAAAGVLAVVLITALRGRPSAAAAAVDRLTSAWSLAELGSPILLLARDLAEVDVPAGSRAVVSGHASLAVLRACDVRRAADVPVEAAVAGDGRRALLFPTGLRPGALALAVAEPALVARLAALAQASWAAATPYVERRGLADLVGEPGLPVETEGRVTQALPRPSPGFPGGVLLRLEDGAHSAAVHTARDDGLVGRRVRIRGRLARDAGGYPVVEADNVVALD